MEILPDRQENCRSTQPSLLPPLPHRSSLPPLSLPSAPRQPAQRGVLVRRVEPTSPVSQVLREGDVVLRWGEGEGGAVCVCVCVRVSDCVHVTLHLSTFVSPCKHAPSLAHRIPLLPLLTLPARSDTVPRQLPRLHASASFLPFPPPFPSHKLPQL